MLPCAFAICEIKSLSIYLSIIIADVIDSDVTTSGGKTRLAIKTLELIETND